MQQNSSSSSQPDDPSPSNQSPRCSPVRPPDRQITKLIASFRYAGAGLWYVIRTQRNAQIHCLIGACVILLGVVVELNRIEWLLLVLTITLVLAAEGINTAIETVVDLITSTMHPVAGIAKDVAAGVVLLCAIAAVLIGCLIFLPHLVSLPSEMLQFPS